MIKTCPRICRSLFSMALAAGIALTVCGQPATGSPARNDLQLLSVSLLPSGEMWALTGSLCKAPSCVYLERSLNHGKSWSSVTLPMVLRNEVDSTLSQNPYSGSNVYFANSRDGWIYGADQNTPTDSSTYSTPNAELWSTHDGGSTWSADNAYSLGMRFGVLAVRTDGDLVYAIAWNGGSGDTFGLWRSPLARDSWRRVHTPVLYAAAGGTNMEGSLVFRGQGGWLLIGNDRGATGSARLTPTGTWVKWTPPCSNVGDDFEVPAAYSPSSLVDMCVIGGYGFSVPPGTPHYLKLGTAWTFTSSDGGLTFAPSQQIGVDNTSQWLDQVIGLPASPTRGVVYFVKTVKRGQNFTQHLYELRDGPGARPVVVLTPSTGDIGQFISVSFASSLFGAAVIQTTSTSMTLDVTTNGGKTWRQSTP